MPQTTSLDRRKLQKLANRYAKDAGTLIAGGAWSSAYYLAGYAIECALKACIAKQFRRYQFPDVETVRKMYTHDLEKLLSLSGLLDELERRSRREDRFGHHWKKVIRSWSETSRYENPTRAMAVELVRAVSDTKEGLLPWIRIYW